MQFVYTAKTAAGDIQTGHISAADVEAVKRALREQSLFLIDVRKKAADTLLEDAVRRARTRRRFRSAICSASRRNWPS